MERIWDSLLFGLACLVGTALFTLGVAVPLESRAIVTGWELESVGDDLQ